MCVHARVRVCVCVMTLNADVIILCVASVLKQNLCLWKHQDFSCMNAFLFLKKTQ